MFSFCDLIFELLQENFFESGEPAFIPNQIVQWVYAKGVGSWDEMSNISIARREQYAKEMQYPVIKLNQIFTSEDSNTVRFHWKLRDGSFIESQLVPSKDHWTAHLSSQVGYPASVFTFSSKSGFKRNLKTAEIVEQVVHMNRWLKDREEKISHVVFRGIGEPLKNFDALAASVRILSHPKMVNLPIQRISLSTVGIVEGIKRLSAEGFKLDLVFALHAPNQQIRKKLIPYANKYLLEEILAAIDHYASATHSKIIHEYALIEGINDHPDHAFELANLLRNRRCTVNIVPFQHIPGSKMVPSSKKAVKDFRTILFGAGIANKCLA